MAQKLTEAQATRVATLEDEGRRRIYTYSYQGKSVIGAFRRFLETDDPMKITPPLRNFLMMVGGFIAHYDLGGFRATYPFAHLLLEEMSRHSGQMGYLIAGQREPERVYRDGMTDAELCKEIAALAERGRSYAERRYAAAVARKVANEVMDGARLLGWVVVPQGFAAVPRDSTSDDGDRDQANRELQQMAEARGLSLVPHAGVKP